MRHARCPFERTSFWALATASALIATTGLARAATPAPASRLARAVQLEREGFPALASDLEMDLLASHPPPKIEASAVEHLVALEAKLRDPFLVPDALAAVPVPVRAELSPSLRDAVSYFSGEVAWHDGQPTRARKLLGAVSKGGAEYGQAQYLLGVIASTASSPDLPTALARFRAEVGLSGTAPSLRILARLAVARTLYAMGRYRESAETYREIPIASRVGPAALLEEGYARFRAGDPGGALGAVQALHAPQLGESFTPESWLLDATIYYFDCLYAEARSSLYAFHQRYAPTQRTLTELLKMKVSSEAAYGWLVHPKSSPLPPRVRAWVGEDGRLRHASTLSRELGREKARLTDPALARRAERARAALVARAGALVKARVAEAEKRLHHYSDQAEVLRFESTKAEKELLESGLDQRKILASEKLFRPAIPSPSWDYWHFQGEFWTDELGSYRFTLANGCPKHEVARH